MGKRGPRRPGSQAVSGPGSGRNDRVVTLREEKTGKRDQSSNQKRNKSNNNNNNKKGVSVKATDMLRIEHLERCAVWAASDAKIPSLAAFYGHSLALARESLGLPPNHTLFQCQRCETILGRDINCTVRARKNKAKAPEVSSGTPCSPTPNYVVYTCHFCSHRNLKKEYPRRCTKETRPSNTEPNPNSTLAELDSLKPVDAEKVVEDRNEANARHQTALPQIPVVSSEIPAAGGPATHIFASESDPSEPVGVEKVVGGRVEVNTKHGSGLAPILATSSEILTTDSIATPVVRIQNVKGPCLLETKMTPNQTFLKSNSSMPVGLEKVSEGKDEANEIDKSEVPPATLVSGEIDSADVAAMAASRARLTLLDTNKRKRKKPRAKKPAGPENSAAPTDEEKTIGKSSKRKRKSWISLKEIADNSEQAKKQNFYNLPIPFSL